jgi:hypothetical protein
MGSGFYKVEGVWVHSARCTVHSFEVRVESIWTL